MRKFFVGFLCVFTCFFCINDSYGAEVPTELTPEKLAHVRKTCDYLLQPWHREALYSLAKNNGYVSEDQAPDSEDAKNAVAEFFYEKIAFLWTDDQCLCPPADFLATEWQYLAVVNDLLDTPASIDAARALMGNPVIDINRKANLIIMGHYIPPEGSTIVQEITDNPEVPQKSKLNLILKGHHTLTPAEAQELMANSDVPTHKKVQLMLKGFYTPPKGSTIFQKLIDILYRHCGSLKTRVASAGSASSGGGEEKVALWVAKAKKIVDDNVYDSTPEEFLSLMDALTANGQSCWSTELVAWHLKKANGDDAEYPKLDDAALDTPELSKIMEILAVSDFRYIKYQEPFLGAFLLTRENITYLLGKDTLPLQWKASILLSNLWYGIPEGSTIIQEIMNSPSVHGDYKARLILKDRHTPTPAEVQELMASSDVHEDYQIQLIINGFGTPRQELVIFKKFMGILDGDADKSAKKISGALEEFLSTIITVSAGAGVVAGGGGGTSGGGGGGASASTES